MYELPEQRIKALRAGIEMLIIEQIYIESNSIKIVRPNILNDTIIY